MYIDQMACPSSDPAAVNPAARGLKHGKVISVCHRQHQVAVGRDRILGHNEMPHARRLARLAMVPH
jgi:hypothetical protein